jgi:hypothetical protein
MGCCGPTRPDDPPVTSRSIRMWVPAIWPTSQEPTGRFGGIHRPSAPGGLGAWSTGEASRDRGVTGREPGRTTRKPDASASRPGIGCSSNASPRLNRRSSSIRSASARRLAEPVGKTVTATTSVTRHGRISITGTMRREGESLSRFASRSSTSVHRSWRRCGDATPSGVSTEACC